MLEFCSKWPEESHAHPTPGLRTWISLNESICDGNLSISFNKNERNKLDEILNSNIQLNIIECSILNTIQCLETKRLSTSHAKLSLRLPSNHEKQEHQTQIGNLCHLTSCQSVNSSKSNVIHIPRCEESSTYDWMFSCKTPTFSSVFFLIR